MIDAGPRRNSYCNGMADIIDNAANRINFEAPEKPFLQMPLPYKCYKYSH
jgi:hypothetical protein